MNKAPILVHYLSILRRRIKVILLFMVTVAIGVGGMTFFGERTYTSRATFLTSASSVPFMAGGLKLSLGGGQGNGVSPELIDVLIQSNRMAEGIVLHFRDDLRFPIAKNLTKQRAHRMIDTFEVTQGTLMGVEATTPDPEFSKELANFCVDYLNTINEQMGLTTDKPMVKMLDPAETPRGPNPRYTTHKTTVAALISGLLGCLFFILLDYFKHLQKTARPLSVAEVLEEEDFVTQEKRS